MSAIRYVLFVFLIALVLWYASLWLVPPIKRWIKENSKAYQEWDEKLNEEDE